MCDGDGAVIYLFIFYSPFVKKYIPHSLSKSGFELSSFSETFKKDEASSSSPCLSSSMPRNIGICGGCRVEAESHPVRCHSLVVLVPPGKRVPKSHVASEATARLAEALAGSLVLALPVPVAPDGVPRGLLVWVLGAHFVCQHRKLLLLP